MGKTVRMSQRTSKSPYATGRRRRSAGQANRSPSVMRQAEVGEEVIYQRQGGQSDVDQIQNGGLENQVQQVAAAVSAQLGPQIRTEIIQTVNSLVSSPGTVTSPDAVVQSNNSGITPS